MIFHRIESGVGVVTTALAIAEIQRRQDRRAAVAQAQSDANAVAAVERLGHELAAGIRRETALANAVAQRDAENLVLRQQLVQAEDLIRRLTAALR